MEMADKNKPLNEVERITSLRRLTEFRARETKDAPAFEFMDRERKEKIQVTYAQFHEQTERLGTFLFSRGYRREKIAILGENSYAWILSFFAIVNGGNIAVPIDRELSAEVIGGLLEDCGCSVVIYSDAYRDTAEALGEKGQMDFLEMKAFPTYLRQGEALIGEGNTEYARCPLEDDAPTAIFYTSGTSGKSKGVVLSQKNLALDTYMACRNFLFEGGTVLLLPLHHTFGLLTGVFAPMLYGYPVFINESLRYLLQDIRMAKPYVLFLVPLFVETICKNIRKAVETAPSEKAVREALGGRLKMVVSGGAPLNAGYIKVFADFGITLLNGYGITECSPVVAVNRNEYHKDGSVGLILEGCQVRIVSPDQNGDGEICVKGPNVMLGYHHMEQETAEVLRDGWFFTGDIGHVDEDGFLYITGRRKNLIILDNGENVAPEALEGRLENLPLVKEVVVYAEKNRLTAEIYPDSEYAAEKQIEDIRKALVEGVEAINRELPAYQRLLNVKVRGSEFEKTTTKKIIRQKVGEESVAG